MKKFLACLLFVYSVLANEHVFAGDFKVVFINPGHPVEDSTGTFWSSVNRFMQAAANDLDIELVSLYAGRDHILMKQLAQTVNSHSPDYVIIVNEKGVGKELVKAIAPYRLPIFTLLNGFSQQELNSFTPLMKSLIIGHAIPNNFTVGKKLAQELVTIHKAKVKNGSYTLLALRGDYQSSAAKDRFKGLSSFLHENEDVLLVDNPVGNWSEEEAYLKVKGLIKRHKIDLVWASNDPMALGAKKAIDEGNLGYDVTIGGINWDRALELNSIDVSYGGHVSLGAKALVMLFDYDNKALSACEMYREVDIFQSSTLHNLTDFWKNTDSKVIEAFDFSRFSVAHKNSVLFDINTFVTKTYKPFSMFNEKTACTQSQEDSYATKKLGKQDLSSRILQGNLKK